MTDVVAVDPGLATGVAEHIAGEITTRTLFPEQFYDWCHVLGETEEPHLVVVCEAFIITAATLKKTFQPWSLEMIGVVKAACHRGKHELWTPLPKPSEAKSLVPDSVLRHLGLWRPGRDHENDALRHLVRYEMLEGIMDRRLLLDS